MNRPDNRAIRGLMLCLLVIFLSGCIGEQTTLTPANTAVSSPTSQPEPSPSAVAPVTEVSEAETADSDVEDEQVAATAVPSPTGAAEAPIAAELAGLPIDVFFEESYNMLLLRDPELITEAGLVDFFGTGNDQLTDISDSYIRETQALEKAILDLLHTYDRASLTPEQQISYDIYEWFLDDQVRQHEFMYYNYPVTFFITAVHVSLTQFFTDIHPVTNRQDAEDYITRLSQVDIKFDQLLEGLRLREEAGIIPPRFAIQWTIPGIRQIAAGPARSTPYYAVFADKVNALAELNDADKEALLSAAEQEINQSVLPAFQDLLSYMEALEGKATDDAGVWRLPDGDAFYAYALRHHTTTDMTAAEIHELGKQELVRIQAEMRLLFDELGYPQDEDLPTLYGRVAGDSGLLSGDEIVAGYEAIIAEAAANVGEAFDLVPQADVIVIGGQSGGYYIPPAVDGSRPGAFYAVAVGSETRFSMPTLAYHEAIPGHHFQIAIQQELEGLPSFRNGETFTAYVEGWALYAELLASELGFYEDDPYGNLGRLQGEAFRAARLVVDTGIHAQGWTFEEAVNYMEENTGLPRRMVEGQIARYIVWPGQATAYKIGMIKILALRQKAMDELGAAFDLKEFHNIVLSNGSVPLDILERIVDDHIESKLGE